MIFLCFDTGSCAMDFAGDGCPNVAESWDFEDWEAAALVDALATLSEAAPDPFRARTFARAADLIRAAMAHPGATVEMQPSNKNAK